jgi:class 3 adenylate cyclase/tetratricopeptide (TPR) repeat protein
VTCPACGHENRDGARFCDACGTPLAGPDTPTGNTETPKTETPKTETPKTETPKTETPKTETVDGGRYQIGRLIGEGSRKCVYLARDSRLDRDVAVALVRTAGLDDAGRRRIEREARAMARLGDHPNIVTVFDVGEESGTPYIVSQYVAGGTLADLLARRAGPLPTDDVLRIGLDVATALDHAHRAGVVHRDLKPANVWLTADGVALLGDFGLAAATDQSRLTAEGLVIGTVAYLAPEQATGHAPDPRADLYSLGALLYELATGRPPFLGDDAVGVITQHLHTSPVSPSWHNPDVPRELDAIVLGLMEKDPDRRPPRARDVVVALERVRDAAAGGRATTDPPALPSTPGAFVGRVDELNTLRTAIDRGVAGHARLVLVVGEPGIGKTRLVEEATTYASIRGARVCWGHSYEGDVGVPYLPFVEALRAYTRAVPDDVLREELGANGSEVATLVSELHQRFTDLPPSLPLAGDAERLRLFDGVTTFLQRASRDAPVVLVLDDLHWADKPTLLLLQYLARNLDRDRLVICGTYRDVDLDRRHPLADALTVLRRESIFERVLLRGLDRDGVKALIEVIGEQETPDDFATTIFRETEGNPFFVAEILRHLAETGALRRVDGEWTGTPESVAEHLPEGIREVIGRRLDRLSDAANRMLSTAAAMPSGFTLDVVRAVTGDDEDAVLDQLDEALEAQIVRERSGVPGTYEFTHALIRQTLYNELNTPRRVRLHRQIAEALEAVTLGEPPLGELAYHWFQAAPGGASAKALEYATRAAERAMVQVAYEEAARFYDYALQAHELEDDHDSARRAALLMNLASAQRQAGDTDAANATLREVAAIARELGDGLLLGQAALARTEMSWSSYGGDPEKVAVIEEALQSLPEGEDALRAKLLSLLGNDVAFLDAERHERLADEAVAAARRSGDSRAIAIALSSWAFRPRPATERAAIREEIARRAEESGDLGARLSNLMSWVTDSMMDWDRDRFDFTVREGRRLADESRAPFWRATATSVEALAASVDGRYDDAEVLFAEQLAMARRIREPTLVGNYGVGLLVIRREQGRLHEFERATRRRVEEQPVLAAWRVGLALILVQGDRLDEAAEHFEWLAADDFGSVADDVVQYYNLVGLSDVAIALGDRPRCERLLELQRPNAGRAVTLGLGAYHGALDRTIGNLAVALGRPDEGVPHLERALELHDSFRARAWATRNRYDLAVGLVQRDEPGDRDRALGLLNDALDAATAIGMPQLVDEAMPVKLALQGIDAATDIGSSIEAVSLVVSREQPDLRANADATGRVTIAFSDIEGYTELTDRLGDVRTQAVLRAHNELLREQLARYGGTEVKSQGDGFMLAFADSVAAVECALTIRDAVAAHDFGADVGPLHVRIGMHCGMVIREGDDFYGRTVIVAARVANEADGEEVLVTDAVAEGAESDAIVFEASREVELKGLPGRHRVHRVRWR